jgi:DNA-binding NtrC family response regulator
VIPVHVPALRERPEDIPALAQRFAARAAAEAEKPVPTLTSDALALLQRHGWPGNVRELQHAVERAVILNAGPLLAASCFDGPRFGLARAFGAAGQVPGTTTLTLTSLNVDEAEAVLIQRALEAAGQNRTRAAELLGISVRTLRNKLNGPGKE